MSRLADDDGIPDYSTHLHLQLAQWRASVELSRTLVLLVRATDNNSTIPTTASKPMIMTTIVLFRRWSETITEISTDEKRKKATIFRFAQWSSASFPKASCKTDMHTHYITTIPDRHVITSTISNVLLCNALIVILNQVIRLKDLEY